MKCYSAFCRTPSASVSFAACFGLCWLPFSFVLSIFSWCISSIICCWECYRAYNTSMKMLALYEGILGWGWGLAPILLTPSSWLGCCCWGIVGLDSACKGTTLMYHVALDLGGICLRGPLSLSVSQLPSGVVNLMWWAFFVFYWATSCGTIVELSWAAFCGTRSKCFE